jgi:Putative DNA-binding domain
MSLPNTLGGFPMYLGPALPRWQPRTVDDVQTAIDDGTLKERHWLDAKAELGRSEGAKKGFAKDLASFANDGGALLIGVREDKQAQKLTIDPVLLDGLSEAVDQIARSRCDPPLYVVCHPLEAPAEGDGKARGLLLVEIPPSPSAPHMVDHRYYGRGDTTNHQLTDADVAQLHAVRTARQATAEQIIAAEVARDPVPASARTLSHLYVVAQPLASPPDLLTSLIGKPTLQSMVNEVPNHFPPGVEPPEKWQTLQTSEPRAEGHGFRSYGLSGRQFVTDIENTKEKYLLDIEVHDTGRVTLFSVPHADSEDQKQYVSESEIVALTRALVTLAGHLGFSAGYGGRWLLAIGASDLHGKLSRTAWHDHSLRLNHPQFSATTYVQGTEAVTVELLTHPGTVTRRLVYRLLRAFGSDQYHLHTQLLTDTDPP